MFKIKKMQKILNRAYFLYMFFFLKKKTLYTICIFIKNGCFFNRLILRSKVNINPKTE